MAQKHFDIALIGCGRIGCLLENDPLRSKPCTHYGGVLSAGLSITHACDINMERLESFAGKAGIPSDCTYSDYRKLFKNTQPAIAIISSCTHTHAAIAIDAARNGSKLIILEKPAAASLEDARALLSACKENNVSLIVNHERRYDSRYIKLKKMLDNGIIGEIMTVYGAVLTKGSVNNCRVIDGGGPLLHDGTHLIDMIRYLFGEIISVQGEVFTPRENNCFEERALGWLKSETGVDIFIEAGGMRDYFVFEIAISGTGGKIVVGNWYEHIYRKKTSKFYSGFNDLDESPFPKFDRRKNSFARLYASVKSILAGKKIPILSTGDDGYKALEVIHSLYFSSYSGKKTIQLPIDPGSIKLEKIFNFK